MQITETVYPNKYLEFDYLNGDYQMAVNITKHLYFGNQRVGQVKKFPQPGQPFNVINLVFTDHLGSSSLVTDEDGLITAVYDYYPYGDNRIADEMGAEINNRFTGQELDEETDLHYFGQRYYGQNIGRFNRIDPVSFKIAMASEDELKSLTGMNQQDLLSNPQALNSYAYALNNPLRYNDPTGNLSWDTLLAHPIKSFERFVFWKNISQSVSVVRPITGSFLSHSASLEPSNLYIFSSNQNQYGNVIDKIKETNQYQDFVNKSIENARNGQDITSGSLVFDKGDLYTSLHEVDIKVKAEQTKDGWTVNTTITDTYDFNPTNPQTYKGTVTRMPATQAYDDQQVGFLSNYDINIEFSNIIKE
jgi:RHS repeat-associated protein